ncbi:hypothetical protein JMF97_30490 [Micromonospora fiedleri]|uniref:Major facilitator superfamily (MFS) profile domain-containing protein n=1 Tax=Micromonospora fiedleri TaxID=1157498 RepID=A0ABS1UVS2_9ACTN|nr:hypothetical protein [Micromonospora fiedleri]MBL6280481.1 hypothetical protein [Micromonospora fiedleri]
MARRARRVTEEAGRVQAGLFLLGGCCRMGLVSGVVPVALLLVPIWLIGGVCNGGNSVFNNLVLARRVPEAARGRAFAAMGAAVQGAAMVGYLIGGLLLEVSQSRPLIVGCGVAGLLVLLGFVRPVRRATRTDRSGVAAIAGWAGAGPAGAGLATSVPVR